LTTWEVIRQLFGGAKIYWRKFFVFLFFVTVIGGGYYYINLYNKVSASFDLPGVVEGDFVDARSVDITINEDGRVTAEGQNLSRNFKILPNSYEISILALDQPKAYISEFQVIMHLPGDVTKDQIQQRVYAVHGVVSHGEYLLDSRTLVYTATGITQDASYTVVAQLPKNIITPPMTKQLLFSLNQLSVKWFLILAILFPLVTIVILLIMVVRRRQDQIFYSSDKIINRPPNDTPPAVVGALTDGRVGAREIAATLIDLACRGYLLINKHNDGTFSFGKRKSLNVEFFSELREFERILLSKIFEPEHYKSTGADVDMRIGRHIFSKKIAQVYLNIYNEAIRLGYFTKNPVTVHLRWRFSGISLFFLSLLGFMDAAFFGDQSPFILLLWVSAMAAASAVIWLSGLMPVRSVTGTINLRQWLQFKRYLHLPRQIEGGAVLEDQFNKMLPYAIVFGVEAEWARRYLKERFTAPDWYESEEMVVTLESFVGGLYPIISYVGRSLDKSHEPTVE
jgi:hypothetical protein